MLEGEIDVRRMVLEADELGHKLLQMLSSHHDEKTKGKDVKEQVFVGNVCLRAAVIGLAGIMSTIIASCNDEEPSRDIENFHERLGKYRDDLVGITVELMRPDMKRGRVLHVDPRKEVKDGK